MSRSRVLILLGSIFSFFIIASVYRSLTQFFAYHVFATRNLFDPVTDRIVTIAFVDADKVPLIACKILQVSLVCLSDDDFDLYRITVIRDVNACIVLELRSSRQIALTRMRGSCQLLYFVRFVSQLENVLFKILLVLEV